MDNPDPLSVIKDSEPSIPSTMANNNYKEDGKKNSWVRFDDSNDSNLPPSETENKNNSTAISMETVISDKQMNKENDSNTSKIDDQQFATIDLTNTSSIQINNANYQNDDHDFDNIETKKQPQLPVTNTQVTNTATGTTTTSTNNSTGSKSNFGK